MAFPSPTSLTAAEDPLLALQSLTGDPLTQLVSLLRAEAPSPTYPHAVGRAPLEAPMAPSAAPPPSVSRQGGVNWHELFKLLAPVVGEIATGGNRGAFMTGFMQQQEAIEARRREQADQQLRLNDAQERREQARETQRRQQLQLQDRFVEDVAQRAADATTPEEHEDILRQYEPIESQYGLTPGSTRTRVRFNATKAERTRRAEAKAAVNDLRTRWKAG
jgi:hypothetical protein